MQNALFYVYTHVYMYVHIYMYVHVYKYVDTDGVVQPGETLHWAVKTLSFYEYCLKMYLLNT